MRVRRIALLTVITAIVAGAITLMNTGSIVLLDPHHEVESAQAVSSLGQRQDLASVGIAYVGVPELEGTIEIRCANGRVIRTGYVTPGVPMWLRLGEHGECSKR